MDEKQKIKFLKMCRDISLSENDLQERLKESPIKQETFILWTEYNKQSNELAQSHQWASFREMRKKMYEFLIFEGKEMPALMMLFQVIHLDLNGPRDLTTDKNGTPEPSTEKPFDLKFSLIDTPVLKDIISLNKKLNHSIEQLQEIYLDTIVQTEIQPLEVSESWKKLEERLKEFI